MRAILGIFMTQYLMGRDGKGDAVDCLHVIDDPTENTRVLNEIRDEMSKLGIEHVTFQIELRTLYQLPVQGTPDGP